MNAEISGAAVGMKHLTFALILCCDRVLKGVLTFLHCAKAIIDNGLIAYRCEEHSADWLK